MGPSRCWPQCTVREQDTVHITTGTCPRHRVGVEEQNDRDIHRPRGEKLLLMSISTVQEFVGLGPRGVNTWTDRTHAAGCTHSRFVNVLSAHAASAGDLLCLVATSQLWHCTFVLTGTRC